MRQTLTDQPGEYTRAKIVSMDLYRKGVQGQVDFFSFEERLSYMRKYGSHCLSFSMLQPEMHYFDIPGMGFIAFSEKWGTRFVLADPVCDRKDSEILLREFLKEGKPPIFVQISQYIAELIHEKFGYYATQFGVEISVDLENWDLKGKKKQVLRTSVNNARKAGVVIEERCTTEGCRQLTDEWLKTRKVKKREIGFLIRPMDMDYQEGTRKFFAYLNGELIGFVFFDPIYADNRIIGYVPNISRFSNKFKPGIFYPLMIHAMETFKKEGVKYLNLGLCPLANDENDMPCESMILKKLNRFLYTHCNWIFSFKGLYFTKSRFDGIDARIFGGTKRKLPAWEFFILMKLCNVL
jgi:phosphatidylglycerol lysyltransferase